MKQLVQLIGLFTLVCLATSTTADTTTPEEPAVKSEASNELSEEESTPGLPESVKLPPPLKAAIETVDDNKSLVLPDQYAIDDEIISELVADEIDDETEPRGTLDIEFSNGRLEEVITSLDERQGLPIIQITDDGESCIYFGIDFDGTIGLHGQL